MKTLLQTHVTQYMYVQSELQIKVLKQLGNFDFNRVIKKITTLQENEYTPFTIDLE